MKTGRLVLDIVLAVAGIYMAGLLVTHAVAVSNRKAQLERVVIDATELYDAFERYNDRHGRYPNAYAEPGFDPSSLDPLASRGYYRGSVTSRLFDKRADGYDSPDDEGLNREFWLEMSLAADPTIRVLVARSDDAPLGGGKWRDGVFLFRDGTLEPL